MSVNGYQFCNLNEEQVDKIKNLELELNQDQNNDDIILLAFTDQND